MRSIEIFTSNGTFTVPAGVTHVTIEAWGAGGSGGFSTRFGGRGGGGSGGAYAKTTNYFVNEGQGYVVTVGQGGVGNRDSWFDNINVVLAKGGINGNNAQGGTVYATGASGSIAGSVGDIIFKGGNGGNGVDAGSGGGGGGAGTIENGGNALSNTGGIGGQEYTVVVPYIPWGGGNGANGVSPGNNGSIGGNYGAGGSGGANTDLGSSTREGGVGGNGIVVITYSDQSLSPTIYSDCCELVVGCTVYINSDLSTPADAGTYYDGTNCLVVNSEGIITDLGSCTPTQHCLGWYSQQLPLNPSNCEQACEAYDRWTSCYQNVIIEVDQIGDIKYTDCSGTLQLIPMNATGYYTLTDCVRYNSITTAGLLTPAILSGVDYFSSSSICGTTLDCGC